MPSAAFVEWSSVRQQRLDNLVAAHRAVTGGGPGRKTLTEEINHALIVRLASEFQGFCRNLHNETLEVLLRVRLPSDPALESIMRSAVVTGRKLDSGNANWANIGSDFIRLGITPSVDLRARYPVSYSSWIDRLDRLNRARNAIAHDDRKGLAVCESQQPLTLATFRRWRSSLSGLAAGLDAVVASYLKSLNRVSPW